MESEQLGTPDRNILLDKRKRNDSASECQYGLPNKLIKRIQSKSLFNHKQSHWSKVEDNILRDNYKRGFDELSNMLSEAGFDRTIDACKYRFQRLRRNNQFHSPGAANSYHWSPDEETLLLQWILNNREKICYFTLSKLLKDAGFSRTPTACYSKVSKLRMNPDPSVRAILKDVPLNYTSVYHPGNNVLHHSAMPSSSSYSSSTSKECSPSINSNPSIAATELHPSSTPNYGSCNVNQKVQNEANESFSLSHKTSLDVPPQPSSTTTSITTPVAPNKHNFWSIHELHILFHALFVDCVPTFEAISKRLEILGYHRKVPSCRQKVMKTLQKRELEEFLMNHPDHEVMDSCDRPVKLSLLSDMMRNLEQPPQVSQSIDTSPQMESGILVLSCDGTREDSDRIHRQGIGHGKLDATSDREELIPKSATTIENIEYVHHAMKPEHCIKKSISPKLDSTSHLMDLDSHHSFNNVDIHPASHRLELQEPIEVESSQDHDIEVHGIGQGNLTANCMSPPQRKNDESVCNLSPNTSNSTAGRKHNSWSEYEDNIVREYHHKGIITVCEKLSEAGFYRSRNACIMRYWRLGGKNMAPPSNSAGAGEPTHSWQLWSPEEEHLLLQWLQNNHSNVCYFAASKALEDGGYTRTPVACYSKVAELKKGSDPAVLAIVGDISADYSSIRRKFTTVLRDHSLSSVSSPNATKAASIASKKTTSPSKSASAESNPSSTTIQYPPSDIEISSGSTDAMPTNNPSPSDQPPTISINNSVESRKPYNNWSEHEINILVHAISMDGVSAFRALSDRLALLGYHRRPSSCSQKLNGLKNIQNLKEFISTHPDLEVMDSCNRPVKLSSLSEMMRNREQPIYSSEVSTESALFGSDVSFEADSVQEEELESFHQGILDASHNDVEANVDPTLASHSVNVGPVQIMEHIHHNLELALNNAEPDKHHSVEQTDLVMELTDSAVEPFSDMVDPDVITQSGHNMDASNSVEREHYINEKTDHTSGFGSKIVEQGHHSVDPIDNNMEPEVESCGVRPMLNDMTKKCCQLQCDDVTNDMKCNRSGVLHLQIHECPPDCTSHRRAQQRGPIVEGAVKIDAMFLIQFAEKFSSFANKFKKQIYEVALSNQLLNE